MTTRLLHVPTILSRPYPVQYLLSLSIQLSHPPLPPSPTYFPSSLPPWPLDFREYYMYPPCLSLAASNCSTGALVMRRFIPACSSLPSPTSLLCPPPPWPLEVYHYPPCLRRAAAPILSNILCPSPSSCSTGALVMRRFIPACSSSII